MGGFARIKIRRFFGLASIRGIEVWKRMEEGSAEKEGEERSTAGKKQEKIEEPRATKRNMGSEGFSHEMII